MERAGRVGHAETQGKGGGRGGVGREGDPPVSPSCPPVGTQPVPILPTQPSPRE